MWYSIVSLALICLATGLAIIPNSSDEWTKTFGVGCLFLCFTIAAGYMLAMVLSFFGKIIEKHHQELLKKTEAWVASPPTNDPVMRMKMTMALGMFRDPELPKYILGIAKMTYYMVAIQWLALIVTICLKFRY